MTRTATIVLLGCLWASLTSTANAGTTGWLLMRPRFDGEHIVTDEPVSQWHQVAAFDTGKECMDEKLTLEGLFFDRAEDTEATAWTMALAAVGASRYVPAEYVYGARAKQVQSSSSGGQRI